MSKVIGNVIIGILQMDVFYPMQFLGRYPISGVLGAKIYYPQYSSKVINMAPDETLSGAMLSFGMSQR